MYPQGTLPIWRLTFSDGTSALASGDHLWHVWRRKRKPRVMTTVQLAATDLIDETDNGGYRWRIPMTAPVQYPDQELPIDPYTLGALIANGYLAGPTPASVNLTTPDEEVHARVRLSYSVQAKQYGAYCPRMSFARERDLYEALGDLGLRTLSAGKFIPDPYLEASVEQRVALLQGLMDGDGSSRGGGRRSINYHTTSRRLANDVQRLVWSLGGTAGVSSKDRTQPTTGKRYTEFQVNILLPTTIEPFHSSRKKRTDQPRRTFEPHRSIVSIEPAGDAECQCISVEADDGLYVIGEEHIVTHNTTVIAELAKREIAAGGRVLLMAHRNELIEQMADACVAVNPAGPPPALIGGPHRGDPGAPIVSATVQSLQKEASLERIGMRDLVIVDEAHHAPANTYRKVLDHFEALGGRRVGFTATMVRHAPTTGERPLREIWNQVVFERDVLWAIENGFLLRPEGVTVDLPDLDVSSLHVGDGEITDSEAEEAMLRETTLNATVEAVLERTGDMSTIVFGASMEHCKKLAEALVGLGVSAEVVVGPTTVKERRGIYSRFRAGKTRVLVTVDVLTEGADFPRCEVVVLARPTKSQIRLVQCVGRGLRPHTFEDGRVKERALVVDLVGAGTLGLIVKTQLDPQRREQQEEDELSLGCGCIQPCAGDCEFSCTGVGCDCRCSCAEIEAGEMPALEAEPTVPCTCTCRLAFSICRCGCVCDTHRVDPLETFDPVSGTVVATENLRVSDSKWSTRTATVRWTRHPRGLVRPVYKIDGRRGAIILADMRGVPGTEPGKDWGFGFFDSIVRRMFWISTTGEWVEPGPQAYLMGMSLSEADAAAERFFPGHLRDASRGTPGAADVGLAERLGVADARSLDRRDLADMIAFAQADYWIPLFDVPDAPQVPAA
ncbi:hypothetical protein AXK58_13925 [Tsukamurella tyrosinosolvens]|uniref:DEAD/DEAH box helicase n=1 Tax=Tsukamurella tyrosinosolvens TaxID=57704 RepID=UPI00079762EA|nr:DEAD/DEAH box helicase [Tsukamurella tyrosinosolvens]KXO92964.1 hypothetical protein AXK58_13925 [Tsukamurella tyrosinosolvens]